MRARVPACQINILDKIRQNVQIFEEILFFEATYNSKINNQLSLASWILGCWPDFLLASKHPTGRNPVQLAHKISKLFIYFCVESCF